MGGLHLGLDWLMMRSVALLKALVRQWPASLLAAAFVVGTVITGNPLSGLVSAMLLFPVAGTGYLIRSARRRRRRATPTATGWLHRDADDFFTAVAVAEVR